MIMDSKMDSHVECFINRPPTTSCNLQLAYEESIRKVEVTINEEGSRRLRLRILLLEQENDELQEQLAVADERVDDLEQECADWHEQIDCFEAKSHHQETQLRMKVRELNNVKAELNAMSGVSVDSTKLLTEKLSLSRELATLKPELEHLRSQATHQQTLLAEKLALQRRVNTLEVELQAEKRSKRRAAPQDEYYENLDALQSQIHELQTEIAKERREKEKMQRVGEKETSEWESRKAVLESKVEQLRGKLRESKTYVKSLQNDLVQAQAVGRKLPEPSPRKSQPAQNLRKRTAVEMTTDTAIGTPDGFSRRGRRLTENKGKRDQTLLGEKSMFSITPYLNRTICAGLESPPIVLESKANDEQYPAKELSTPSKDQNLSVVAESVTTFESDALRLASSKTIQPRKSSKQDVLTDSKNTTANKKAPRKKGRGIGALDKLAEEVDENAEPAEMADSAGGTKFSLDSPAPIVKEKEPKKKKRKLLGATKTLFEEEDGGANKRPSKSILEPRRSFAKGVLSGGNIGLGADIQRNSTAFGAFSPLKRDKKSLQASFVA